MGKTRPGGLLERVRRRQTLASFDYQWGELAEGEAMLSDPWFVDNVDGILADQLLAVDRTWFPGRRVLDAGCGGGRWTVGLLRLGCDVTAIDFSTHALETTRRNAERLAPAAVAEGRLTTLQVDLLSPPAELTPQRFDLVYSFGVLHHTGDTRAALATIAPLVADDGLLFLYLYGAESVSRPANAALETVRIALSPLSFAAKRAVIARLFPKRDTHQAFDLFSPLVNDRLKLPEVEDWLRGHGFTQVARTLEHTELFLRATRDRCSAPLVPLAKPPYWTERYSRRKPSSEAE